MTGIVLGQERRTNSKSPSPQLKLSLTVLPGDIRLFPPLEGTVMLFVQPPGAFHGNPHAIKVVQYDPEGADGTLQDRGKGDIDFYMRIAQASGRTMGLPVPLVRQVDIGPPGETIFTVVCALSVA